jgi:GntR family transcriptional regulator/MocR family aminotransferase
MRQVYGARRNFTADLLASLLPEHEVRGIAGGLHAVLGMPSHAAAASARTEARAQGVEIDSIDQHTFAEFGGPAGLVIGYGALPEPTLAEALAGLAEIVRSKETR